jgi:hypothetical protein
VTVVSTAVADIKMTDSAPAVHLCYHEQRPQIIDTFIKKEDDGAGETLNLVVVVVVARLFAGGALYPPVCRFETGCDKSGPIVDDTLAERRRNRRRPDRVRNNKARNEARKRHLASAETRTLRGGRVRFRRFSFGAPPGFGTAAGIGRRPLYRVRVNQLAFARRVAEDVHNFRPIEKITVVSDLFRKFYGAPANVKLLRADANRWYDLGDIVIETSDDTDTTAAFKGDLALWRQRRHTQHSFHYRLYDADDSASADLGQNVVDVQLFFGSRRDWRDIKRPADDDAQRFVEHIERSQPPMALPASFGEARTGSSVVKDIIRPHLVAEYEWRRSVLLSIRERVTAVYFARFRDGVVGGGDGGGGGGGHIIYIGAGLRVELGLDSSVLSQLLHPMAPTAWLVTNAENAAALSNLASDAYTEIAALLNEDPLQSKTVEWFGTIDVAEVAAAAGRGAVDVGTRVFLDIVDDQTDRENDVLYVARRSFSPSFSTATLNETLSRIGLSKEPAVREWKSRLTVERQTRPRKNAKHIRAKRLLAGLQANGEELARKAVQARKVANEASAAAASSTEKKAGVIDSVAEGSATAALAVAEEVAVIKARKMKIAAEKAEKAAKEAKEDANAAMDSIDSAKKADIQSRNENLADAWDKMHEETWGVATVVETDGNGRCCVS